MHDQSTPRLSCDGLHRAFDIGDSTNGGWSDCDAKNAGSRFDRLEPERIIWADFRVEEIGGPSGRRRQFLQNFDPLLSERELEPGESRDIAAGARQTCNKALADRIPMPANMIGMVRVASRNAATFIRKSASLGTFLTLCSPNPSAMAALSMELWA